MYIVALFPYFTHFLGFSSQNKNLYTSKNLQIHMRVQFITFKFVEYVLQIQDKMLQHEF